MLQFTHFVIFELGSGLRQPENGQFFRISNFENRIDFNGFFFLENETDFKIDYLPTDIAIFERGKNLPVSGKKTVVINSEIVIFISMRDFVIRKSEIVHHHMQIENASGFEVFFVNRES